MTTTHRLQSVLDRQGVIEVSFRDGEIFEISDCYMIHASVYGRAGGWGATVENNQGMDENRKRFFRPGSKMDFYEEDIQTIRDKKSGTILFETK